MAVTIDKVISRMFDQNAYILGRDAATDVMVVDPGFSTDPLLEKLQGKTVAAIVLTHGHCDHIAGVKAVKQAHPAAPIVIGQADEAMLSDAELNLSAAFGVPMVALPADRTLADGERLAYAGLTWEAREIPGHSPGSMVYVLIDPADGAGLVVGGDVLFAGSVGRTDFPGGSMEQLINGIHAKLLTLPGTTRVLPGHGPATTIQHETIYNPYLTQKFT